MLNSYGFAPITPHIHRLELRLCGAMVAVWLVESESGWSLVDCGAPRHASIVRSAVERRIGGPPQRIICTHGHFDHAGALPALVAAWRIPVLAHAEEIPYITGPARYAQLGRNSPVYRLLSLACSPPPAGVPVDRTLGDGEPIGGMRAIHVPGHTPGMIALLHEGDRALIAADAFRFKLFGAMPMYTADRRAARDSMRKLVKLEFDHLLTSHNRPMMWTGRAAAKALDINKNNQIY